MPHPSSFLSMIVSQHTASAAPGHTAHPVDGIQILRALCALLVVVSHENGFLAFTEYFGFSPLPSLHVVSLFAVATFFAISGFIISVSSLDRAGATLFGRRSFAIRRTARILPFLWLCTLAYNALSALGTGRLDLASMARTILISPLGELKPNVVWSIRHEMLFYILFGLAIMGGRQRWGWLALWCLAPLIAAPLIWDWGLVPQRDGAAGYELFKLVIAGGESGANVEFGAGLLVGLFYRKRHQRGGAGPSLHYAVILLLFALSCALVHATQLPSGLARIVLWAGLSVLPVLAAVLARPVGSSRVGRLLCALGDSSFSLYLVHNAVMLLLLSAAKHAQLHLADGLRAGLFLFACVMISILACDLLYRCCERPLIRWSRTALRRLLAS